MIAPVPGDSWFERIAVDLTGQNANRYNEHSPGGAPLLGVGYISTMAMPILGLRGCSWLTTAVPTCQVWRAEAETSVFR